MRYSDQLEVEIKVSPGKETRKVVPSTIQLLIENVTEHNVISKVSPMKVTINAAENGITVSNPIRKKKSTTVSRIGVRYLIRSYERYGKDFHIENDGETFTAHVPYL